MHKLIYYVDKFIKIPILFSIIFALIGIFTNESPIYFNFLCSFIISFPCNIIWHLFTLITRSNTEKSKDIKITIYLGV